MSVSLSFFGAAGCVTGACMLLQAGPRAVLIDCGMFQGPKTLKALNYDAFPFDASAVDAVLLTHAHIDHSGLLPKLALEGFNGPIYATTGTRDLCGVLLPDAGAIQEMEVEWLNRRNLRHGKSIVAPIFTGIDAERCLSLFQTVELGKWMDVADGVRARWWHAGHILGSASIEVEVRSGQQSTTLLFSGDIGPGGRQFSDDPTGPSGVDYLIMEATYGAEVRSPIDEGERRQRLALEVAQAHAAGGPLLIPAFAVERTQELIIDLVGLIEDNLAPPAPIFLDSPLAIRASEVFLRHDAGPEDGQPFERLRESQWLKFTERAEESRALERLNGWHIIIAGSGMCDAGRVRHHLKRLLWRPEATVLLTGYQATGTLGRLLQEGSRAVRILGDDVKVKARIRTTDIYSGHADANGLLAWALARGPIRSGAFLIHGEPENLAALNARLRVADLAGDRIETASLDQTYELSEPGARRTVGRPPRLPVEAVARLDWHNARSAFLAELNAQLDSAPDDAARERIIADLKSRLAH